MTTLRRAVLATALAGVGLASTAGAAMAGENHDTDRHHGNDDKTSQEGLVNVGDVQTVVPLNACNNDIPVNVLGVQVPLQDLGLDIPLLSSSDDGGNGAAAAKTCGNGVGADN